MRFLLALLICLAALPAHAQRATVVASCGAVTQAVGQQTNWLMDTTGRVCLGQAGAGGQTCAQASNYLARTVGGNEGGNATAVTNLVCGLVADGVIDGSLSGATACGTYLDALYIPAQQNVTDARLNLCGTNNTLTPTGTPGFVAYRGVSAAAGSYNSTGFIPSSAPSPKFKRDDGSFGVWSQAVVQESTVVFGTNNGSQLYLYYTGLGYFARIQETTSPNVPSPGLSGYFVAERNLAAYSHAFWNGTDVGIINTPSTAIDVTAFTLGGNGSTQVLGAAHIGKYLGPTLEFALYNRLKIYMAAVTPCPQAANYLARTQGGNEGGNATNISNLICGLAADGVITGDLSGAAGCGAYLDVLFLFAQQNQADADLNLCGTSFKAASFPTNIFQSYIGYHGFSTNNIYANLYDPTIVPGAHYTINNASMGAWFYTLPVEATFQVGLNGDVGNSIWAQFNASGAFFARITNDVVGLATQIANKGFFVGDRQDSSGVYPYYNGAQLAFQAGVGKPIASSVFAVGKLTGTASASTISEAHIGGSLGAAKETALYNRLRTYMTAVGVP